MDGLKDPYPSPEVRDLNHMVYFIEPVREVVLIKSCQRIALQQLMK